MDLPQEAVDRRARSLAILMRESIPYMAELPVIETSDEARLRSREEIAYRTLSLLVVALKGEGLDQPIVERIIREHDLSPHLTPLETAFVADTEPTKKDRIRFSWRYECAWVLLWALGYVDPLGQPFHVCDVPRAVGFMRERTTAQFLADAKERPLDELLNEADLICRYNWACVSARLQGKPAPGLLDAGVVQERHHALNWLIGYMDQDWDDVTTDT